MKKKTMIIPLLIASLCAALVSCKGKAVEPEKTSAPGKKTEAQTTTVNTLLPSDSEAPEVTDPSVTTSSGMISIISDPPKEAPKPNETDELLFEKNGISVYYRGIEQMYSTTLSFFVVNETDDTVNLSIDVQAVNRYALNLLPDIATLTPYGAALVQLNIWGSSLEAAGITEISEITVLISAYNTKYSDIFDDQQITFILNDRNELGMQ